MFSKYLSLNIVQNNMKLTEGLSEICGVIIGDGWIQSNEKGLFITGNQTEDKDYYDNYLVPLIRKELKIDLSARYFSYWRTYGVAIYRKELIKIFLKLGMLKGEKASRAFIPNIFKKNKKYYIALLRGVFDTDGSIYFMKDINPSRKSDFHIRPRLRITSISENLINDIKFLTKNVGIISSNPSPSKWRGNKKPSHIFEINQQKSIHLWLNLIGTKNPVHQTKIAIWKKFGFVPPKTTLKERVEILKDLRKPEFYYTTRGSRSLANRVALKNLS